MEHNKTLHLAIIIGALISLLLVSTTYSNFVYAQNKFRAKLDANNEVPPVDSTAEGVATFKIKDDSIKSKINITGIADVSGAQIFSGKIGQIKPRIYKPPELETPNFRQRLPFAGCISIMPYNFHLKLRARSVAHRLQTKQHA